MGKNFSKASLLLGAVISLSGCADWENHVQSTLPASVPAYTGQEITVAEGRSVYEVVYRGTDTKITEGELKTLHAFLDGVLHEKSNGVVMVEQPGKKAPRVERQRAANLADTIRSLGWRTTAFETDTPGTPNALRVVVDTVVAVAPSCPNWEFHKYYTYGTQAYPNFACADRNNLAAMIADPSDLVSGNVPSPWTGQAAINGEMRYRTGSAFAPVGSEVSSGGSSITNVAGGG